MTLEKTLILGSVGFSGSRFRDYLEKEVKPGPIICSDRVPARRAASGEYRRVDLLDREAVLNLLRELQPDLIFNFAGLLFPDDLHELFLANVLAAENLLISIGEVEGYAPRVLLVGSAAEYGVLHASELPVKETCPKRPISNYGLSKVFLDALVEKHLPRSRARIYRAKPFNIIGPGQSEKLVFGALLAQLKRIKEGEQPPELHVGNLNTERDFVDLRDAFSAYWRIIRSDCAGEVFHVASGIPTRIGTLVETLLRLSGVEACIVRKDERVKIHDPQRVYADISKIRRKLGWEPRFSLERSIRDVLSSELSRCLTP